jgi:tRNA pseudouridine55 synthase
MSSLETAYNGLLLVNKPTGMSSFDIIRRLRRITGFRKIGHAGTLDPAASGLMLLLFGPACKQAMVFTKLDKRYGAEITLGYNSSTGDREGELTRIGENVPSELEIHAALEQLTCYIIQTPSVYSAIKINGQEAYKRARAGEKVEMPSRQVTVYESRLLSYEYPILGVDYKVSSGTYIRTLAEDLGKILATGGYLSALERTEVGQYKLEDAVELEGLEAAMVTQNLRSVV